MSEEDYGQATRELAEDNALYFYMKASQYLDTKSYLATPEAITALAQVMATCYQQDIISDRLDDIRVELSNVNNSISYIGQ